MNKHDLRTTVLSKAAAMLLSLALCLSLVLPAADLNAFAATDNTASVAADNTAGVAADNAADASADSTADDDADDAEKTSAESEVSATSISNYDTVISKRLSETLNIEADITPAYGREVQLQRYSSEEDSWATIVTVNLGEESDTEDTAENAEEAAGTDDDADAGSNTGNDAEEAANADGNAEETSDIGDDAEAVSGAYETAEEDTSAETTTEASAETATETEVEVASETDTEAATTTEAEATPEADSETAADTDTDADAETIKAGYDTARVCLTVPQEERMKTSSVWRIYVPATENAAEAYSEKISVITRNLENLSLSAKTACIYRIDGNGKGTMIFSRNSYTKVAQASTTKLMTAILLIESGLLDSTTKISNHAASTPWGSGRLAAGDVYNNRDLLFAMLLPSSNDAATAIAERVGGSEGGFVNMMNAKAEEMGFTRTHFCNPHGLDADGHYTTALELAKLTAYAYTFPEIRECWATQYKTIRSLKRGRSWTLWSTNAIFSYVRNFLGGKTGTEDNAGCCFTGVYTYNGSTYVTVVLGSGYGFSRWSDTKKLHKYIQDYAATSY